MSAGDYFFWGFCLLCLLGDGVAQFFHDGIELGCVVGIGYHIGDTIRCAPLMDTEIQHTILLGKLLESSDVLFFEVDNLCRSGVTGQPLGGGLAYHLVILVGYGD